MHLSLHIIAEHVKGIDIEVVHCEERRGIIGITSNCDEMADNILLVSDGNVTPGARHVILTSSEVFDRPDLDAIPNLAVVQGRHTLSEVLALISQVFVELAHWDARMLEAIAARQGIDAVLKIASERLANPAALFDSKLALLAHAGELPPEAEHTIWEDVLLKRYSPDEFYTPDERSELVHLSSRSWPFIMNPLREYGRRHLTAMIRVDNRIIGSIGQVDVQSPFTPGQIALTDLVACRLQLAMAMRLGNGPAEDDTTYLIRSILNGTRTDRGLLDYHLSHLGWHDKTGFILLLAEIPASQRNRLGDDAKVARFQATVPDSVAMLYEGNIVIVMPEEKVSSISLRSLLTQLGMRSFTSETFESIADMRLAYDQCILVASLPHMQEEDDVRFSDAYEQVLPAAMETGVSLDALCDHTILDLARRGYKGDIERGRSLARELYVYLMRGCNAHQAARELFLHRNTLIYHVEQLERLLGCRFDELSTSHELFLEVSCLIALGEGR